MVGRFLNGQTVWRESYYYNRFVFCSSATTAFYRKASQSGALAPEFVEVAVTACRSGSPWVIELEDRCGSIPIPASTFVINELHAFSPAIGGG